MDEPITAQLAARRPGSDDVQAGFLLLALFVLFVVLD